MGPPIVVDQARRKELLLKEALYIYQKPEDEHYNRIWLARREELLLLKEVSAHQKI